MTEPAVPSADQSTESASSITNISGSVNITGEQVGAADVIGRDKVVSTTYHIEQATIVTTTPSVAPAVDEAPAPGEPPFKGLHYFDVNDADLFFGREQLTAQLVTRLRDESFLAIVGASGSGKSSLVRAGMIPALRREHPHWQIHLITPTAHPLKELAASLTREVESVTATATLIDDLTHEARSLDLAAAKALKRANPGEHLLLVVDQFEELFIACKDENEQRACVENLMHAVAPDTNGPLIIIITLRADFYTNCARFDFLRQALEQHQAYIGPMSTDELRRAIEAPAQRTNWQFELGLVELLLHDVGDEPGALPLLSHALLATWQRRRGRTLTLQGYTEAGGVSGAIAKTADEVMESLRPEQRLIARSIFLRLTELGEGTQDTRRPAALNELAPRAAEVVVTEQVLRTLTDARLITTGKGVAEVAHEALIREWPTLRAWLDEDREALRVHRQLTEDAREWLDLGRDDDALYRGTRLDRAIDWAKDHADDLNPLEREFFEASLTLRQREQAAREAARQKELDDARQMAEMAEARARAEVMRTRLLLGIILLGIIAIITARLAIPTVQGMLLHEQTRISMLAFPAAEVYLGTDGKAGGENDPLSYLPHQAYQVGAFAIDPYEVTNHRYLLCVQAGVCSLPISGSDEYSGTEQAGLPVVNVYARQAYQFCDWLGARLPDEQEWERAARAGATPEGVFIMAGNALEWTRSNYDLEHEDWTNIDVDPPEAVSVRGSGANSTPGQVSNIAYRLEADPWVQKPNIGFRCAVAR